MEIETVIIIMIFSDPIFLELQVLSWQNGQVHKLKNLFLQKADVVSAGEQTSGRLARLVLLQVAYAVSNLLSRDQL